MSFFGKMRNKSLPGGIMKKHRVKRVFGNSEQQVMHTPRLKHMMPNIKPAHLSIRASTLFQVNLRKVLKKYHRMIELGNTPSITNDHEDGTTSSFWQYFYVRCVSKTVCPPLIFFKSMVRTPPCGWIRYTTVQKYPLQLLCDAK